MATIALLQNPNYMVTMKVRFILTDYVNLLMTHAVYAKLEDGTYTGRIPTCKGVIAFGPTLRDCEEELRSTLEDWILVGLKLGHPLPVIAEIDLNKEPTYEPVEAL
jgi:predicted RNase H-like HicB family nuclease